MPVVRAYRSRRHASETICTPHVGGTRRYITVIHRCDLYMLRVGDTAKRRLAKKELLEWIDSMGTVRKRRQNRHIRKVVKLFKATWDDIHIEDDKVWCDAFRGGLEQRCRELDPTTHRVKPLKPFANADRTRYPAPNMGKAAAYQHREIMKFCNRLCTLIMRHVWIEMRL